MFHNYENLTKSTIYVYVKSIYFKCVRMIHESAMKRVMQIVSTEAAKENFDNENLMHCFSSFQHLQVYLSPVSAKIIYHKIRKISKGTFTHKRV